LSEACELTPARLPDYHKLYADDESWFSGKGEAYKHLGIDTETGCIAVVRPDQTVSLTCKMQEYELLGKFCFASTRGIAERELTLPFSSGEFFSKFMLKPTA